MLALLSINSFNVGTVSVPNCLHQVPLQVFQLIASISNFQNIYDRDLTLFDVTQRLGLLKLKHN